MRLQLRILGVAFILLGALTSLSCSKSKTKSQQVLITATPTNPVVFTTDYTYTAPNGDSVSLKNPWFEILSVTIENQSDTAVQIVGLHVEVTGTDSSGNFVTNVADFIPGTMNIAITGFNCTYPTYGTFTASGTQNSKGILQITKDSASPANCPTWSKFDVGNNPAPTSTVSIVYTVKIKPIGYFVNGNGVPIDRFENFTTVYTK